jgi:hypothetical protein
MLILFLKYALYTSLSRIISHIWGENSLRIFENRMLRRTSGNEGWEVRKGWRNECIMKKCELYPVRQTVLA